jgi:hypothetical protein
VAQPPTSGVCKDEFAEFTVLWCTCTHCSLNWSQWLSMLYAIPPPKAIQNEHVQYVPVGQGNGILSSFPALEVSTCFNHLRCNNHKYYSVLFIQVYLCKQLDISTCARILCIAHYACSGLRTGPTFMSMELLMLWDCADFCSICLNSSQFLQVISKTAVVITWVNRVMRCL